MGTDPSQRYVDRRLQQRARRRRPLWVFLALVVLAALGLAAGIVWWSGATLAADAVALARVEVQPLGGSLVSARAFGAGGARIPLSVTGGRLVPRTLLTPGEKVSVVVRVRRPSWLGWALGHSRTERLTLHTPVAHVRERWLTVARRAPVVVRFTMPVAQISVRPGRVALPGGTPRASVSLGRRLSSGTLEVASAPRRWERLGTPERITWFPASRLPVVLVSPRPSRTISPRATVTLTFSKPLQEALDSAHPRFSARVSGTWRQTDTHTLVFTPSGLGFPLASSLRLDLPGEVSVSSGAATKPARAIAWQVAGASFLRLQQLLAEAGYLPLDWQPTGTPVAREAGAEIDAAVSPPAGTFHWRYSNTPSELQHLWIEGQPNQIVRGAVMMFQHDHDLSVDSFAGAQVWRALLADAIAGTKRTDGYSYVYVHRNVPQLLTLWHNGQTVLTSPGNTGVPAAPTQLGTYPVFEHIPVGTMSGTNPDGSHYNDPGIRWISYFHQGEALHAFTRASFGTPQSLGCVELPLATAARVWPYTPIGTLVTIED
jgi:peptidoglycan hydrolase-like protein with peptidoglycan-binding domain